MILALLTIHWFQPQIVDHTSGWTIKSIRAYRARLSNRIAPSFNG